MSTITNIDGTSAGVTSNNRLMGETIVRDYGQHVAISNGWAFSCQDDTVTPTGAADVFCRIANISADPLVITKIRARCASADVVSVQTTANYTSGGTHADKAAVNRTAGSSNLFTTKGTFESDVNITGDSGSVEVCRLGLTVADTDYEYDLTGGNEIVLRNGYSLLLEAVTGTAAMGYEVFCHFAVEPYTNG